MSRFDNYRIILVRHELYKQYRGKGKARITQERIAEKLHIGRTQTEKILNGKAYITFPEANEIGEVLGVSAADFTDLEEMFEFRRLGKNGEKIVLQGLTERGRQAVTGDRKLCDLPPEALQQLAISVDNQSVAVASWIRFLGGVHYSCDNSSIRRILTAMHSVGWLRHWHAVAESILRDSEEDDDGD